MNDTQFTQKMVLVFTGVFIAMFAAAAVSWINGQNKASNISSFEECQKAGYPITDSYPQQCNAGGRIFLQD